MNTPAKLAEDLSWQKEPGDPADYGFKTEHARQIVQVTRQLCGASTAMSDEAETAGIIAAFLGGAQCVEERSTYRNSSGRYEAALALRRELESHTGRPIGPPRYLIDAETGEVVIGVQDLGTSARQQVGSSLARGWLHARMAGLGWQRITLDGHALPGRAGRTGPHLRMHAYRGLPRCFRCRGVRVSGRSRVRAKS